MTILSNRLANPPPKRAAMPESSFHRAEMLADSPKEQSDDQLIYGRFEKIVLMYPNRLAIQMGDHRLTYEELNHYANRISRAILEQRGGGK